MIIKIFVSLITLIALYFTLVLCYFNISGAKIKVSRSLILFTILGAFFSTFISLINHAIMTNIYTILFLYCIIGCISKMKMLERFYYAITVWLFGMIADIIVMLLISVTNLTEILLTLDLAYVKVISTIVMIIILLLFTSAPIVQKMTQKFMLKIKKIQPSAIISLIILSVLIYLSILCAKDIINSYKILFYVSILIILLLVVYIQLDKYFNIKKLKEINNLLIKSNDFFIKLDSDYRILKHNLTNQLLGIRSVSNDKSKKLIDDLIIKYNSKFVASNDISKIPKGINGIIYEKFYSHNDKEINLVVNNRIKSEVINNVKPKTFNDLCESLGVLIDNAIEAVVTSENKLILVDFEEDDYYYIIDIINSYNEYLDVDSIGLKDYSTKKRKSGIGIFSLLNRNNINIKIVLKNGYYQTKINVKKNV